MYCLLFYFPYLLSLPGKHNNDLMYTHSTLWRHIRLYMLEDQNMEHWEYAVLPKTEVNEKKYVLLNRELVCIYM